MKIITSIILSVFVSSAYAKNSKLLCESSEGGDDAIVTLSELKKFKKEFNCVSGGFVVDLSGCAPNGEYGLHAPTGGAALIGVVDRWQEYSNHYGGITSNYVSSSEIYFSGGFNSPDDGYKESWSFSINRLSGVAKLKNETGSVKKYLCKKAANKF